MMGKVWLWTVPLVLAACDDGGNYNNGYPGYYGGYCEQFTSCEACTPIVGCGWCTDGSGKSICLSDPDSCRAQEFTWTWEPNGCGVTADAGGSKPDAEADAASDVATPACHWPDAADTFSASDAGTTGCMPSTGGDLCSSSQYTLTCYGTSTPDAALGCTASPVTTPANVAFNCCPCAQ
jgi:hypothetical protein